MPHVALTIPTPYLGALAFHVPQQAIVVAADFLATPIGGFLGRFGDRFTICRRQFLPGLFRDRQRDRTVDVLRQRYIGRYFVELVGVDRIDRIFLPADCALLDREIHLGQRHDHDLEAYVLQHPAHHFVGERPQLLAFGISGRADRILGRHAAETRLEVGQKAKALFRTLCKLRL